MAITRDEWEEIAERLETGCTGYWEELNGNRIPFVMISNSNCSFLGGGMWNIPSYAMKVCGSIFVDRLNDFRFPDGTPMLSGEPISPVIRRIRKLDRQFKAGTLPKVKTIPLPLGL